MDKVFNSKEVTLKNGVKFVSVKKDTQLATVQMGIKIGSLYENKNEKGISHFIEHMLFKGTNKRNNEQLNSALEQLGGEYNAYTDYNCTVYSITALEEELENSIELLSDMIINSDFPTEEMEKERSVILAEIKTSKDDVEDYSFTKINEIAFSKSPLKYDTIGEVKTVKNFSREELVQFYESYYVPNNSYITIVSPFEHEEVLRLVEKYLEKWQSKDFKRKEVIRENNIPQFKKSYKKEIEQSTILYLFTFHDIPKHTELALRILNHKFGESANSILFRELREDRGLAYDVYTHLDTTNCVKTLYIYTAVAEENVEQAVEVIDSCIERIKNEEITFDDSNVNLMKKVIKTAVASTLEDCTDLGNYILHQLMDGENIYEFVEDMKNLNSIKKEHIYDVARAVFKNPTIHILLPQK